MAGIVVVFDFDKTIIDLDSDNWVVDELGATNLFNQLLPTMPWNSVMVGFSFHIYTVYYVQFNDVNSGVSIKSNSLTDVTISNDTICSCKITCLAFISLIFPNFPAFTQITGQDDEGASCTRQNYCGH